MKNNKSFSTNYFISFIVAVKKIIKYNETNENIFFEFLIDIRHKRIFTSIFSFQINGNFYKKTNYVHITI